MLPKTDERFKLLLSYVQITFILIWTNKYVFFLVLYILNTQVNVSLCINNTQFITGNSNSQNNSLLLSQGIIFHVYFTNKIF